MNGTNDLVVIAKTWLQREEQFPIDFDEIWERAGYTLRVNALRAFHACVANFDLAEGSEYKSLKTYIPNRPGKPGLTFKMTVGAAKRFLASAQTQEGFKTIDALIKAEEELTAIKANIETHVAGLVDQRITAMIPVMIEKVTSGVLAAITPLLAQNQISAPRRGLSMRELVAKSRTLVSWHDSIHQNYGYDHVQAARSFGKIVKTAARNAGALIGKQNGVEVYDESKLLEIVEKASAPMASFSRRNRNRYQPAPGQLELGFTPTFSRN